MRKGHVQLKQQPNLTWRAQRFLARVSANTGASPLPYPQSRRLVSASNLSPAQCGRLLFPFIHVAHLNVHFDSFTSAQTTSMNSSGAITLDPMQHAGMLQGIEAHRQAHRNTVGQNSQELGGKYWATRSSIRLHRSLICLPRTACFACVLHCANSFARPLTHSQTCRNVNY